MGRSGAGQGPAAPTEIHIHSAVHRSRYSPSRQQHREPSSPHLGLPFPGCFHQPSLQQVAWPRCKPGLDSLAWSPWCGGSILALPCWHRESLACTAEKRAIGVPCTPLLRVFGMPACEMRNRVIRTRKLAGPLQRTPINLAAGLFGNVCVSVDLRPWFTSRAPVVSCWHSLSLFSPCVCSASLTLGMCLSII